MYINNKNNAHCPLPDTETCDACMSACFVRQTYIVTTVLTRVAGCHSQVLDHPLLYTAACINQAAILQQACNTASCKALRNTLINAYHQSTSKFRQIYIRCQVTLPPAGATMLVGATARNPYKALCLLLEAHHLPLGKCNS